MGILDAAMNIAKDTGKNLLGVVEDCTITMIDSSKPEGMGEYKYRVPFNPKDMSLDANMDLKPLSSAIDKYKEGDMQLPYAGMTYIQGGPPKIILTVPLIFDEVNISDAFTSEKITVPGSASMVKSVATAGAKAFGGSEWTVQPVVEGFLGALRNKNTRTVKFNWGEFEFRGWLKQFNSEYTMFSPSGNPIRAKVMMRIQNDFGLSMWQTEAMKILGVDGGNSFVSAGGNNSFSNILNKSW
ncbi:MAG: hypothetical protein LBN34_02810 [Clostridiales Family XIII bacterium]|jgi:hypothetical protein|nr:hypothetical protein [Clostridiales Family XIII bacterium]